MSDIIQGVGAFVAGGFQAEEAEREAKLAEIQADEIAAAMTADLTETLGNIDLALAASMRDPTSPTAAALRRQTQFTLSRDILTERQNLLSRAAALRRGGKFARTAGTIGLVSGVAGTAEKIAKAAASGGGGGGGG